MRQPARVVFDSKARLPLDSQLLRTVEESPVIAIVSPEAEASRLAALRDAGAEALVAEGLGAALSGLGDRGITSLLLEGGATLVAAFVDAGEVDEARVFVAPILLGSAERLAALDPGARDTLIEYRFKEW